jgi:Domain of unknown function (DUF4136)
MSLWVSLVVAGLLSTPAYCEKVKVEFSRAFDFSKFKTYTWTELGAPRMPLLRADIVLAIDQQLEAKGLTKTDKDGDLVIAFSGDGAEAVNQRVSPPAYLGLAGPPPSIDSTMWTGSGRAGMLYPRGTLVIELMNPTAGKIVWRASANVKFDMEKKGQSVSKINETIVKMFRRYPPTISK